MQNKANFLKEQMNVSFFYTKDYENTIVYRVQKNKPKQTQFQIGRQTTEYRRQSTVIRHRPSVLYRRERREKWNVSHSSSDFYYRTMRKSRAQIYDELLVIKCQQGDREAFEELVSRWQKRLWHYAFKVTASESAAWDIVQETWFGIIKGIRKLEDVSVFPRWAFRIANNKCSDWLRRQRQQHRLNNELTKQTENESDKKQDGDEKAESLRAAVEKLSPDRRALLTLRYHEGFDIGQIAEILNVPEGTVKSRLHRTLNQLRKIVERYDNG